MKKYGKILKSWRLQHKITQKELAKIIEVSQQAISFYENEINIPSIDIIERLADYYNVSIDELIDRDYIGYTKR